VRKATSRSAAETASGLVEVYVRVRPPDIAFLKFIFESYETVGFLRTIDPRAATLAVFLVPDFADIGLKILEGVSRVIALERIAPPDDLGDDWLVTAVANESD